MDFRNVADPVLSIPPEVLLLLVQSTLQSASVNASRCSGPLLFRIMIPSFCVPKRYLPSRGNLLRSASPGDASVLLTSWTAKSDLWAVLEEMPENTYASVASSSVFFTQSWLIFVTILTTFGLSVSASTCTRCRRDPRCAERS